MSSLDELVSQAHAAFEAAADPVSLENAKARFLGKSGLLTEQLKGLASLDAEAKRTLGAQVNLSVLFVFDDFLAKLRASPGIGLEGHQRVAGHLRHEAILRMRSMVM
ncbi:MAG: hypothetical protein EB068_04095, partial [Betaproteobacteria bacterium]|nr:hypothetical protein [Betaproteobacteria bacterium]